MRVSTLLVIGAAGVCAAALLCGAAPEQQAEHAAGARALVQRAAALEKSGDTTSALARLAAALAIDPANAEARAAIARLADQPPAAPTDLGNVNAQLREHDARLDQARRDVDALRDAAESRQRTIDQIQRRLDDKGRAETLPERLDRDVEDLKRQVERLSAAAERAARDIDRLRNDVDRLKSRP